MTLNASIKGNSEHVCELFVFFLRYFTGSKASFQNVQRITSVKVARFASYDAKDKVYRQNQYRNRKKHSYPAAAPSKKIQIITSMHYVSSR